MSNQSINLTGNSLVLKGEQHVDQQVTSPLKPKYKNNLMTQNSVSHYSDGRNAWKLGVLGFLLRFKGIALTVVFTLITMGIPWWWPGKIPDSISFKTSNFLISLIIAFGSIVSFALYYLRNRTIRSLNIKYDLHMMVHELRNFQTELHEKLIEGKSYSKNKLNKELEILLRQICDNNVGYFSKLTGDERWPRKFGQAVKCDICYH